MPPRSLRVRCRQIGDADLEAIFDLLVKSGFVDDRSFWLRTLHRLSVHVPPAGYPKYGFLLEVNGVPVGMLLLISSTILVDGRPTVRCNVSCWYVWPAFRAYGTLLVTQALRHKEATYINISPLPHTFELLAAQGYTRYCSGLFTAVPALNLRSPKVAIATVTADMQPGDIPPGADLPAEEIELLLAHASYGCTSVIVTLEGRRHPFVFELSRKYFIGFAYLVYCRSIDDFVEVAGRLGRFLIKRGYPLVVVDANGPIPGLFGRHSETSPKYFKGPDRPRLGDVAYSERAMLGLRLPPRADPEF